MGERKREKGGGERVRVRDTKTDRERGCTFLHGLATLI